jgi:hypothetical protein
VPLTLALAGRRTDASNAEVPRFPMANVPLVRERLRKLFADWGSEILVCSAACGADLVALDVAENLGMRRRVILPFDPATFRGTSVTDRPGDWGPLYDRVVEAVRRARDLVVLDAGYGDPAYLAANERILDEAVALSVARPAARPITAEQALAVIVWEGSARGPDDVTYRFAEAARMRGLRVEPVLTLEQPSQNLG